MKRVYVSAAILTLLSASNALGETISIDDPNISSDRIIHDYRTQGPSSWSGPAQTSLYLAVPYVSPGGKDPNPSVVVAEQNGTQLPLSYFPYGTRTKNYQTGIYDTSLTGEWTITITNEDDVLEVVAPSIDVNNLAPEITGGTLSGLGTTTPTLSWETPLVEPDVFYVNIFNLLERNEISNYPNGVGSFTIDPTATSFTVPEGLLEADGYYSISLASITLRDEGFETSTGEDFSRTTNSWNSTFYDITTADFGDISEVYVPQVDSSSGSPQFIFNNAVTAGLVEYYDPLVAVGYDYNIGAGDPNFASFILPDLGDGLFDLFLFDGNDYLFETQISANQEYFFDTGGVDMFRILGIETSAGLDPNDVSAFATGLSFVADGRFTGTMTPISVFVDDLPDNPQVVPLPASALLLLASLGLLSSMRRRRVGF